MVGFLLFFVEKIFLAVVDLSTVRPLPVMSFVSLAVCVRVVSCFFFSCVDASRGRNIKGF